MSDVPRARVPETFSALLGVCALLWAVLLVHVFVVKGSWDSLLEPSPRSLEKVELERRVWTNASTGVYYCSDSSLYGRTTSGQYMNQGEALQRGYTPALNAPCR